jgi:hypothetical protein
MALPQYVTRRKFEGPRNGIFDHAARNALGAIQLAPLASRISGPGMLGLRVLMSLGKLI